MIQLVSKDGYHNFETVEEALDFLWGKDTSRYSIPIPNTYKAARQLMEIINVPSQSDSRLDQPGRAPTNNSSGDVPPVHPRGDHDAQGSSKKCSEQPSDPVEEVQNGISGSVPIGLGFQAGPRRG